MNINKLNKLRPKYNKIVNEYKEIYNLIYNEIDNYGNKILLEFGKIVPKPEIKYGEKQYINCFNLDWVQKYHSKEIKLIDDYFELSFWSESYTTGCDPCGCPEYFHDAKKIHSIQITDEFNVDEYIKSEINRYNLESENHELYLLNKKEEDRINKIKQLELEIKSLQK